MYSFLKLLFSKYGIFFKIIMPLFFVLNILLFLVDYIERSFTLDIFYYISANLISLQFLIYVGTLFFLAYSFRSGDKELRYQFRRQRFHFSVISGFLTGFAMVAFAKSDAILGAQIDSDLSMAVLSDSIGFWEIIFIFFLFSLFGLVSYYIITIMFGWAFRIMVRRRQ